MKGPSVARQYLLEVMLSVRQCHAKKLKWNEERRRLLWSRCRASAVSGQVQRGMLVQDNGLVEGCQGAEVAVKGLRLLSVRESWWSEECEILVVRGRTVR